MLKFRDWLPDKVTPHISSNCNISSNPNALEYLEKNPDKINWFWLSLNPAAIPLLEKNLDKIQWTCLSSNPAAIKLLEANPASE